VSLNLVQRPDDLARSSLVTESWSFGVFCHWLPNSDHLARDAWVGRRMKGRSRHGVRHRERSDAPTAAKPSRRPPTWRAVQSRWMRRAPPAECPVLAHAPGGVPRTSRPLARARLMVERAKEARPVPVTSELLGFTQPVISHHAKILVGELGMQAGLVVLHGR